MFIDQVLKGYALKKEKVGGASLLAMPDNKKSAFVDKTSHFSNDDFLDFKPIFHRITKIIHTINERG